MQNTSVSEVTECENANKLRLNMDKTKILIVSGKRLDRNVWTETSYVTVRILQMFVSIYKRYAIDNADPSSMQDARHMNFVIEPLWLSGKASEC